MKVVHFMLLGAALGMSASGTVWAGNGIHPRPPVLWEPAPACMTVVDRTVDAKLAFTYTIPYEDLRPVDSTDEVDDSRRHQFIALCAGHSPQEPLPVWLSVADVMQAEATGTVKLADLDPQEIFETSAMWKDCFTRITADDARRLITFAEAGKPVVWDTTGLAAGAYLISGYTWEPVFNIWSRRPGVVKVIDDPDPTKSGPALAITNEDEIKYSDEVLTVVGCVDAMDGSTITGYWARTSDDTPKVLEWMPFAADTPVSGESFALDFSPPPESVGQEIAIKAEIVDPMDRRYTAHMSALASILEGGAGDSGDCADSSMNFITPPECESASGGEGSGSAGTGESGGVTAPTGSSGGGGEDTGVTTTPMAGDGGCGGCVLGGGGSGWLLWTPCLLWLRRRRA